MKKRDLLSGIFWFVVAIIFTNEALKLQVGTFSTPGPGLVILLASLMLGLFSLVLVVAALVRRKESDPVGAAVNGSEFQGRYIIASILLALIVYIVILPFLGFILATTALMTFVFYMVGRASIWFQGMIGLVTVLCAYLLFSVWLKVPLPKGPWGF